MQPSVDYCQAHNGAGQDSVIGGDLLLLVANQGAADRGLGEALKDEVIKITPVQKMSAAGQRTRFKARGVVPVPILHMQWWFNTASAHTAIA